MNIQPIQYNNSVSMQGKKGSSWTNLKRRVAQKILDTLPSQTQNESAKKIDHWNKFDNWVSKPAQNRAIMGATAIITQPAIDYNNHKVDKETRRVARNRTIAGNASQVFPLSASFTLGHIPNYDCNIAFHDIYCKKEAKSDTCDS